MDQRISIEFIIYLNDHLSSHGMDPETRSHRSSSKSSSGLLRLVEGGTLVKSLIWNPLSYAVVWGTQMRCLAFAASQQRMFGEAMHADEA